LREAIEKSKREEKNGAKLEIKGIKKREFYFEIN